jgi:hypothetical protein
MGNPLFCYMFTVFDVENLAAHLAHILANNENTAGRSTRAPSLQDGALGEQHGVQTSAKQNVLSTKISGVP